MPKSDEELAQELRRLANCAPSGEKMPYLMLFGIKYADLLHRENITRHLEGGRRCHTRPNGEYGTSIGSPCDPERPRLALLKV